MFRHFLYIFIVLVVSSSYSHGQVDFPDELDSKEDILHYLTVKSSEKDLDPLEYFGYIENLKEYDLNEIDLLLIESLDVFSVEKQRRDVKEIESLTREEAHRLLSLGTILNLKQYKLSSMANETYLKTKKELLAIKNAKPISKDLIKDILFHNDTNVTTYQNGKYSDTPQLYLFCRKNRKYPCLFILKDIYGQFVRTQSGELWNLPALAKSKRNLQFNQTNGHTPTGVHTIDSVMPEANRQGAFGKFRRLILNWVPKGRDVDQTLSLIPRSSHRSYWWKQASIARDVGRKYLRIHGTGRVNTEPNSSYFPHVPTSGCISTKEGKYGKVTYADQRVILDKLMKAMQLAPVYSNEVRVKGVLFVIELNDLNKPVTLSDLRSFWIR